jgi:tetratricopeptide (TPR) repeat protein
MLRELALAIALISSDRAFADPFEDNLVVPNGAVAYRWRGENYYEKREYDNAVANYSIAIALEPSDDLAYRLRGQAYEKKHDLADYSKAIALDPKNAFTYRLHVWTSSMDGC